MLILLSFVLLCCSALFSASETALFSLNPVELERMRSSTAQRLLRRLVDRRSQTLITLLLGNLLVNLGFFSLLTVLAARERADDHALAADFIAPIGVALVILCGEVTPKLLAVRNPAFVATLVAIPVTFADFLLSIPRVLLSFVSTAFMRLLTGPRREEGRLRAEEVEDVLRLSAVAGHIAADERERLQSVLLLSRLSVREIMVPRVQLVAFDMRTGRTGFMALVAECQHNKLPVHHGDLDAIDGWLDAKEVGAQPERALESLVQPLRIIPEVARVSALLPLLIEERRRMLLVVDEYGGTAGLVTHADLEHAVLGDMQDEGERDRPMIVVTGAATWSVDGVLALSMLHVLTGRREETRQSAASVGGLVMTLLDRVPVSGDRVSYAGLELEVTEMRRHRPARVSVRLAAADNEGVTHG